MIGALATSPVSAAPAQQMTISDLQTICAGTDDEAVAACKFYILGVTEGGGLGNGLAGEKALHCVPEGVPATTMVSMVKNRIGADLARFPDDRSLPAVSFVTAIMIRAYPCPS
jgi:hypothetical protein